MKLSNLITAAAFGLLLGVTAASAQTSAPQHPRVAEVQHRSVHQDHRITRDFRHDHLTFAQAERLRARERMIRNREVRMERHDHGHLTKDQTARLNHDENRVGHKL